MSEPILLVVERGKDCTCEHIQLKTMFDDYELGTADFCGEFEGCGWDACSHGATVRLATAADIPADLAAEALGLSAEDLYGGTNYAGSRTARLRASNLVREAETGGKG